MDKIRKMNEPVIETIMNDMVDLIETTTNVTTLTDERQQREVEKSASCRKAESAEIVIKPEHLSIIDQWLQDQAFNESLIELDAYMKALRECDEADEPLDQALCSLKCDVCKTSQSVYWRRVTRLHHVCNDCFYDKAYLILFDDEHLNAKPNSRTSSRDEPDTKELKRKQQKLKQSGKSEQRKSSNDQTRPLTRTTLNNRRNQQQQATLQTQLSSSSTSTSKTSDCPPLNDEDGDLTNPAVRKSSRISKSLAKTKSCSSEPAEVTSNGNTSRRNRLLKSKQPVPLRRCDTFVSKIHTSDYVFHRGFYMKVGDIVALLDKLDPELIYFAQIRAFLVDQYGQKSAVLTWLIPTSDEHKKIKFLKDFDPSLFALGPAEEYPRSLDSMEFVCRLDERYTVQHHQKQQQISFNHLNQYKNDLLRHKFELEDLAAANFTIITKKTYFDDGQHPHVQHEIKFD